MSVLISKNAHLEDLEIMCKYFDYMQLLNMSSKFVFDLFKASPKTEVFFAIKPRKLSAKQVVSK